MKKTLQPNGEVRQVGADLDSTWRHKVGWSKENLPANEFSKNVFLQRTDPAILLQQVLKILQHQDN